MPGVKVNGQFYWDILLSQQMLAAIRHIEDDNFVFWQETAVTYCVCNTVKLLQCKTLKFILLSYSSQHPFFVFSFSLFFCFWAMR